VLIAATIVLEQMRICFWVAFRGIDPFEPVSERETLCALVDEGTEVWPARRVELLAGRVGRAVDGLTRVAVGDRGEQGDVGRKNWLFLGSDDGGEVNSCFTSLLASCRMLGIEPWSYLRDLLCLLLRWPQHQVLELAPANWAAT
jgi:hypothetical protein